MTREELQGRIAGITSQPDHGSTVDAIMAVIDVYVLDQRRSHLDTEPTWDGDEP